MRRKIGHGASRRLDIDRDIRELGGEQRGRTVSEVRRDTIYAGARTRTLDPKASLGRRFDTLYGGKTFDTLYGGKRFDTIYAGKRFDTIYAGRRSSPLFGGGRRDAITYWGAPRQPGGVTMTVKDPGTGEVRSVVYNPATRQYLDTTTERWMAAPAWMRAQLG